VRYLDRDLPPALYDQFRNLAFVRDSEDLDRNLRAAVTWGSQLLRDLESSRATSTV
jgi:hypothetical protein